QRVEKPGVHIRHVGTNRAICSSLGTYVLIIIHVVPDGTVDEMPALRGKFVRHSTALHRACGTAATSIRVRGGFRGERATRPTRPPPARPRRPARRPTLPRRRPPPPAPAPALGARRPRGRRESPPRRGRPQTGRRGRRSDRPP